MHAPKPRVLISHQGCVPVYRKSFFERLADTDAVDYVVAYGDPPRGTNYFVAPEPYGFPAMRIANREFQMGGKGLVWQTIVGHFAKDFDAAVLGEEVKFLSHFVVMALARLTGRPVLLWGFGYRPHYIATRTRHRLGRWLTHLGTLPRALMVRLCDGYMVYSPAGAAALTAKGFATGRIAVLHNTVDIEREREFAQAVAGQSIAASRARHNLPADGAVLVYMGRLLPAKHVELLVEYVLDRRKKGRAVNALIVGEGPEQDRLAAQANGSPHIVFQPFTSGEPIAHALRVAAALVIPGFVGLAITHAFAHDLPTVTRQGDHPPEIAYLESGHNGLMLPADKAAFFAGLDAFLDDPALQARLRAGAHESAGRLSMSAMAGRFDALVRTALARRGRMPAVTAEAHP